MSHENAGIGYDPGAVGYERQGRAKAPAQPEQVTVIAALQPGDIIRHKHSSDAMIVTANYGDHAVAVRTQHVSNPIEWLLVGRGPAHR